MSLPPGYGKHSCRCLATRAHSAALQGVVTVFTSQDTGTVKYTKPSGGSSVNCTSAGNSQSLKRLLLENASQFLLAVNYEFCVRKRPCVVLNGPVSRTDDWEVKNSGELCVTRHKFITKLLKARELPST